MSDDLMGELLRASDFCEGECWWRREVSAGEVVFQEGAPGSTIYLVLQGNVRIAGGIELDDGRRIRPGIRDLGEGEIFGELVLFGQGTRSATASAIRDSTLIEVDGTALLNFFDAHPEIGYRAMRYFMEIAVERLRETNRKLMSVLAWGLRAREIDSHL